MFILDQPYRFVSDPWPHLVVDNALPESVAFYLATHFPPVGPSVQEILNNQLRRDWHEDPLFHEFTKINRERANDLYEILDEAFDDYSTDQYKLSNFTYRAEPPEWPKRELRGWHIDKPTKKYHMMYYLGGGNGGELEMLNEETGYVKSYPYTHNKLIVWKNEDYTFHRFFTSDRCRQTISIGVEYN